MDDLALFIGYMFLALVAACLLLVIVYGAVKTLRQKVYYPIRDCIRYKTPSIVSCRCRDCLYAEKIKGSIWTVKCTRCHRYVDMPEKGFCSYAYRFKSRGE